jgi:hypothetical protein
MAAQQDYLVDENNDLVIQGGDFVVGESDFIHVNNIIQDAPGDNRQYPEVGFNITRYRNAKSNQRDRFTSELREQLQADGYRFEGIVFHPTEWWKDFVVNVDI